MRNESRMTSEVALSFPSAIAYGRPVLCVRKPVCDNPQKTVFLMRPFRLRFLSSVGLLLAAIAAWPQAPSPLAPKQPSSIPLVLAGGTVVDVTDWGRSAKDLPDAVVILRDGRITDVGSRMAVTIPKGARVIDCTGKFLIPGLIDGFAGHELARSGQC